MKQIAYQVVRKEKHVLELINKYGKQYVRINILEKLLDVTRYWDRK